MQPRLREHQTKFYISLSRLMKQCRGVSLAAFKYKYHTILKSLILHQKKLCGLLNPLSYYQIYYFIFNFLIFLKILIHFCCSALFINELGQKNFYIMNTKRIINLTLTVIPAITSIPLFSLGLVIPAVGCILYSTLVALNNVVNVGSNGRHES